MIFTESTKYASLARPDSRIHREPISNGTGKPKTENKNRREPLSEGAAKSPHPNSTTPVTAKVSVASNNDSLNQMPTSQL